MPILVTLRDDMPVLAALHPVGALLALWVAILVAVGAARLVRVSESDIDPAPAT